jgi:NADH dehydrogenase
MLVALTGATGFVGRHLAREVRRRGHQLRILARNPAWLPFPSTNIEIVGGSLATADAVGRLVAGADAVIHLVGIIAETGSATFQAVHVEGTRTLVRAAARAGVRRLVHMSAIGARHDPAATPYHRSKAAGEDEVRGGGVSHAILRPSFIVGRESVPITVLARLHRLLPVVPVFGSGDFPLQPVWVGDVAAVFVHAAEGMGGDGTYELGGPDPVTYGEFVRGIGVAVGRQRPLVHIPLGAVRALAEVFDLLPPALAPITSHQLQMLVEGSATPANAIARVFGIRPMRFEDALRRALQGDGGRGTGEESVPQPSPVP